jgi:hypothetical protein
MNFDREKIRKKLKAIVEYEINMGLVKSKAEFARKYKTTPQKLNYYLTRGSHNVYLVARICEKYRLTSDYLIFDKKPDQEPPKEFLPPIILPCPEAE